MTTRADDSTAVRTEVAVNAPPETAFAVFTDGMDRWWPRTHNLHGGELKATGVEPQVGGRLWQENDAGEVCTWGRVLTWEPPREFVFSWMIGPDFAVPALDAPASRVTVTFTATSDGTLVRLVHDQLDAHGSGWEALRDGVSSDGGWSAVLAEFANAC